jgi:hypothetical protein
VRDSTVQTNLNFVPKFSEYSKIESILFSKDSVDIKDIRRDSFQCRQNSFETTSVNKHYYKLKIFNNTITEKNSNNIFNDLLIKPMHCMCSGKGKVCVMP